MSIDQIITIISVLLGSGLLQWWFGRKDKQKEDAKKNNADSIKKEMQEKLKQSNAQWKEDYCDKNAKLIGDLANEVRLGLEEREKTGKQRYIEHQESIKELRQVMKQLTLDAEERKKLERYMSKSLMAITHDKLVYLGKVYQRRGAITLAEKNNLKLLYEPYHDGLGGNSDGEGYFNYCMSLPVITDEEAKKLDDENKQEIIRQLANRA